jgi:hypothetical protein
MAAGFVVAFMACIHGALLSLAAGGVIGLMAAAAARHTRPLDDDWYGIQIKNKRYLYKN